MDPNAHVGAQVPALARQINLRDLWPPLFRSRYAILGIFVGVFSLAAVITLLMKPIYRATATVEIKQEAQKVLGTEDQNEGGGAESERFLATQLDIIKSRSTALAVAQSLGLANNQHFFEAIGTIRRGGELTGTSAERLRGAVGALQGNLEANLGRTTRIAEVEYAMSDPDLAAQIANSFADNYIRLNLERRFDASRYSLQFLRGQIAAAQARLGESERNAITYSRQSRLIDAGDAAGGGAPKSLTTASLVQFNSALSDAVTRRIAAQQKWEGVRAAPLLSLQEVLGNGVIQGLLSQQAGLRGQYEQQLQTRREDYPAVKQLSAQIDEIGRQITLMGERIRNSIRQDYETILAQENSLRRNIEVLKTTTLDEQNRTVQLSILQRQANTNRQQLDALLNRYNEVNAQSGIQLNNLAVIDRAEAPGRPFWPNIPLNAALALLTGIILSGLYVLGRENLFEMVRTPKDVNDRLHLANLGAVPASTTVLEDLLDSKSASSEAFSTIRTSLSLSSGKGVPKSLMFTSTQAGEGKSTACYGLAASLAKIGRRVIVIDADLRRPNVHRLFQLKNSKGLSNVLALEEGEGGVIHRNVLPGVDVMTAGPIPPNPAELLALDRLATVVASLEEQYDNVLIDSAPVLGLADAPLVAVGVRAIVFVIESARTSVRGVTSALGRLRQTERPIAGVILSRFNPGESGYGYEYKYEYRYAYSSEDRAN